MVGERITTAEVDRIDLEQQFETARQTASHRHEFPLGSLRTAFLINGGGLISLYTVLSHILDKGIRVSRAVLLYSAALMILGRFCAALGQLGYYRAWDDFSRAHFGSARNMVAAYRGEAEVLDAKRARKVARGKRSLSRALVLVSVLLFGAGAITALEALLVALPKTEH